MLKYSVETPRCALCCQSRSFCLVALPLNPPKTLLENISALRLFCKRNDLFVALLAKRKHVQPDKDTKQM